jgi:hypothetical protein
LADESTITEIPEVAPTPAVATGEGAPDSPVAFSPPADDLDRALAEFDAATKQSNGSRNKASPEALEAYLGIQEGFNAYDAKRAEAATRQQSVADTLATQRQIYDLQQNDLLSTRTVQALQQSLAEMRHAEWFRQEAAALNKLVEESVSEMREAFPDIPRDFVESWWNARALTDPTAVRLWDNRHQNPRGWENYSDRLRRDLYKVASSRIDPSLTEDRNQVAAAVLRNASTAEMPTEPPTNLSLLSDKQYREYTKQKFGFEGI